MMPEAAALPRASRALKKFAGPAGPGEDVRELTVDSIRRMHRDYFICGRIPNQLLMQRDDLVLYVRSLLSDEMPGPAEASLEEWHDLVSALRCHWVIPLIYKKARRLPVKLQPPAEIMGRLKAQYTRGMELTVQSDRQIAEIIDRFTVAGIRVLLLKGAAYSRTAYPDPAVRYGSDLDFLILPDDIRRSFHVLADLGYKCMFNQFECLGEYCSEEPFIDDAAPGRRQPIEIHWALNIIRSIPGADMKEVFRHSVPVHTPWVTAETLDPVDSLIHAAQHMMLHHTRDIRLIWIYDVSMLARKLDVPGDWKALQERSVRYGARISVENALQMAQLWTGLPLPRGFEDFSLWPSPSAAEAKAYRIITGRPGPIAKIRMVLPAEATVMQTARILLSMFFPSASYMRKFYPPPREWLLPLSYCYRPIHYLLISGRPKKVRPGMAIRPVELVDTDP